MKLSSTWIIAALSSRLGLVQGYSTGAGGCSGGMPAVSGLHREQSTIVNGTLDAGRLTLVVNDVELNFTTFDIKLNTSATNTIYVSGVNTYKGVLYRLEAHDESDVTGMLELVEGDSNTKFADNVCVAPVAGVTHANSDEKNEVPVTLITGEDPALYHLDVTIVLQNSADRSEYYYSRYTITVGDVPPTDPPTPAPTEEVPAPSPTAPSPTGSSSGATNAVVRSTKFAWFGAIVFVSSLLF
jgi:hypothetical protein